MNVLFFSELFYPHGGGAEFATYLYAKLLSERGFKVTVVTNRFETEPEYSETGNIRIHRIPIFSGSVRSKYSVLMRVDFFLTEFIRRLLRQSDVVYIPRLWYNMVPFAKFYKKPVIVHLHDYTPICPLAVLYDVSERAICEAGGMCSARCIYEFERGKKSSLKESIMSVLLNTSAAVWIREFIKRADAIVCVSDAQRKILVRQFPSIGAKTDTIYNPLPDLQPVELSGEDFGYFGGANHLKGFEVLYEALVSLDSRQIKVHVTGMLSFTKEMQKFYSRVGMILSERLDYDKQEAFYRMISAVVFPSIISEPLPYVTAEAMLRGRILIASRIGGVPEQVKDCEGVFMFEPGRANELAKAMKEVKSLGKERIVDLGHKNRESFLRSFNNEKTIGKFISIIERLT